MEVWADTFANRLRRAARVHSVKARVKDPEHLIAKIIRKKLEEPGRDYTLHNYTHQVNDLIGLRALHLFKTDWLAIHEYVIDNWDTKPDEPIKAYVRKGDPQVVLDSYTENGCHVEEHRRNYRSIHYVLEQPLPKNRKLRFELQVRTLFEEGWGEVDHLFSYPNNTDDELISYMSGVLNRAAGIADEMSSFIGMLQKSLQASQKQIEERDERLIFLQTELRTTIQESQATAAEKSDLEAKLKKYTDREKIDRSRYALWDHIILQQSLAHEEVEQPQRHYPALSLALAQLVSHAEVVAVDTKGKKDQTVVTDKDQDD